MYYSYYPVNKYYNASYTYNNSFAHYGILGMKWGVRRYQNPDGSLTAKGMNRYGRKSLENAQTNLTKAKALKGVDAKKSERYLTKAKAKLAYTKSNTNAKVIKRRKSNVASYLGNLLSAGGLSVAAATGLITISPAVAVVYNTAARGALVYRLANRTKNRIEYKKAYNEIKDYSMSDVEKEIAKYAKTMELDIK